MSIYLKCGKIEGELTGDHEGWIEVLSFSHGLSQPISCSRGTGDHGSSTVEFQMLTITKNLDTATIDLNKACCNGTVLPIVELEFCQTSNEVLVCFWKYELGNAFIQSVTIGGSNSDRPYETVTFAYKTIKWTYKPLKDGGETTVGPKGWDLGNGKELN